MTDFPDREGDASSAEIAPLLAWCVCANIRAEARGGKTPGETYHGTPIFRPNAKLYAGEIYWGMYETGHFVGLNRVTRRLSNAIVNLHAVRDCRTQPIYSASLLVALRERGAQLFETRADADAFSKRLAAAIAFQQDRRTNVPDAGAPMR